jgi:signal transduction histidine kinase
LNAERHAHVFRGQLKEPAAWARVPQIEQRNHVACEQPAERSRRPAQAHVHQCRGISLKLEPASQPYYLQADRVKIAIALSNLVKNAIQYTEAGGNVNVRVEEDTGYIKVTVTDNGIGIPPRELPRIFDRFYQVETHLTRRYGGMGLGLSVAKAMIELHGGRIWADSEGRGSRFTFLLPANLGADSSPSIGPFIS